MRNGARGGAVEELMAVCMGVWEGAEALREPMDDVEVGRSGKGMGLDVGGARGDEKGIGYDASEDDMEGYSRIARVGSDTCDSLA